MITFNEKKLKKEMKSMGALLLCALIFSGCKNPTQEVSLNKINSTSFFAMDTVMEIQIEGDEELLTEAQEKVEALEKQLSVTEESSEVSKINKDSIGRLTGDGAKVFEGGMEICKDTEGALDLTIYPVLKEWGFTTGEYKVPEDEDIKELLQAVDYSKVEISNQGEDYIDIVLPENMEIDLGSITKGYTSQMLSDFFKEKGVDSALINLGGNVQCIGTKQDGSPWKIAIKSPFHDSKTGIIGVLESEDIAIVTSGGYERYFEENGEIYWHIINPENGYPAKNGLVSVSIVGKDGFMCDGLSTALFVKGLEGATEYWKTHEGFDMIMITEDGKVYITEGIKDKFSLSSEYKDAKLNVIIK
ncbi:thiamine biosynthesis lipoprotein [Pseudobutyrivibrio sp. YE44]|uniref:FAD:protein FMN transferase n=1 Tax=Pseudobutyrivibrio sp. YE44 TaxID=1520802 RepID=UPI00088C580F|nr:FAD:protein FMN transferase [Pseudobutyrivibrio sp. YE44]SDB19209.1 thiamine biosynthesis lipoprotein [Pseudobutyrivibrio sp. YE44]